MERGWYLVVDYFDPMASHWGGPARHYVPLGDCPEREAALLAKERWVTDYSTWRDAKGSLVYHAADVTSLLVEVQ